MEAPPTISNVGRDETSAAETSSPPLGLRGGSSCFFLSSLCSSSGFHLAPALRVP